MGYPITKEDIRRRVWQTLEEKNIASFPRPCIGRIPNFIGSDRASGMLIRILEFQKARCVFSAPDFVLQRAREIVLEDEKILAVALPNMVGFVEIVNPQDIRRSTTIKGFRRYGSTLKTEVDLFIQGSVAVDIKGNRLGKGKGYGDKEWAWLLKRGLLKDGCKVVTIVHDEQIVEDFSHLVGETDKKVDYILTPTRVINI